MRCRYCGQRIPEGELYCRHCGKEVRIEIGRASCRERV